MIIKSSFAYFSFKKSRLKLDLAEGEIIAVVDALCGLGGHGLSIGVAGTICKLTARHAGTRAAVGAAAITAGGTTHPVRGPPAGGAAPGPAGGATPPTPAAAPPAPGGAPRGGGGC